MQTFHPKPPTYNSEGVLVQLHYSPDGTETACGWLLDAIRLSWTTEPGLVEGCFPCGKAAAQALDDAAPDLSAHPAFRQGYARGKEAGFADIRRVLENPHQSGCGCNPCAVIREVRGDGWV